MNKKHNLRELFQQAEQHMQLYSRLDYAAIIAHDPHAVAELQEVLRTIRGNAPTSEEGLADYAIKPAAPKVAMPDEKAALAERRRALVEVLGQAGLSSRLGKVYCSTVDARVMPFREVTNKQGLPQFDMVIAADFSPHSGYHGIFVAGQEVMSWILPSPYERPWQVRERHRFSSLEQMAELVSLLSAGFPVE